jgi:exosortase
MTQTQIMTDNIALNGTPRDRSKRLILFGLWIVAWSIPFARHLQSLIHSCLENDNASHILLIPFISAWVLYLERQTTFRRVFYDFPVAAFFLVLAAALYGWTFGFEAHWSESNALTGYILTLLLLWIAGFALFFGRAALNTARFSLLFLLLAVPLPDFVLNRLILYLQEGSAAVTAFLFDLTGVPVLRVGFVFHFPRVSIEIAKECSGIRSSMAVFILVLLVAHFRLRSFWKKVLFLACGLFMMILKNGIRIVSLTLLAMYVDLSFLYGKLHYQGGVVFFILSLLLLAPILWLLQRGEVSHAKDAHVLPVQSASKLPSA